MSDPDVRASIAPIWDRFAGRVDLVRIGTRETPSASPAAYFGAEIAFGREPHDQRRVAYPLVSDGDGVRSISLELPREPGARAAPDAFTLSIWRTAGPSEIRKVAQWKFATPPMDVHPAPPTPATERAGGPVADAASLLFALSLSEDGIELCDINDARARFAGSERVLMLSPCYHATDDAIYFGPVQLFEPTLGLRLTPGHGPRANRLAFVPVAYESSPAAEAEHLRFAQLSILRFRAAVAARKRLEHITGNAGAPHHVFGADVHAPLAPLDTIAVSPNVEVSPSSSKTLIACPPLEVGDVVAVVVNTSATPSHYRSERAAERGLPAPGNVFTRLSADSWRRIRYLGPHHDVEIISVDDGATRHPPSELNNSLRFACSQLVHWQRQQSGRCPWAAADGRLLPASPAPQSPLGPISLLALSELRARGGDAGATALDDELRSNPSTAYFALQRPLLSKSRAALRRLASPDEIKPADLARIPAGRIYHALSSDDAYRGDDPSRVAALLEASVELQHLFLSGVWRHGDERAGEAPGAMRALQSAAAAYQAPNDVSAATAAFKRSIAMHLALENWSGLLNHLFRRLLDKERRTGSPEAAVDMLLRDYADRLWPEIMSEPPRAPRRAMIDAAGDIESEIELIITSFNRAVDDVSELTKAPGRAIATANAETIGHNLSLDWITRLAHVQALAIDEDQVAAAARAALHDFANAAPDAVSQTNVGHLVNSADFKPDRITLVVIASVRERILSHEPAVRLWRTAWNAHHGSARFRRMPDEIVLRRRDTETLNGLIDRIAHLANCHRLVADEVGGTLGTHWNHGAGAFAELLNETAASERAQRAASIAMYIQNERVLENELDKQEADPAFRRTPEWGKRRIRLNLSKYRDPLDYCDSLYDFVVLAADSAPAAAAGAST